MMRLIPLLLLVACDGADVDEIVTEPGELATSDLKADGTTGGVEIKITVRADQIDRSSSLFHLESDRGERRTVYFYDTPALALFDRGTILRARKIKDGADD